MTKSPESSSGPPLERAIEIVRDMVRMWRRRGEKTEYALPDIADALATKPHRVRSLFYRDKMWPLSNEEADRIQSKYVGYLDREIALSIEYTTELRAKRDQASKGLACTSQCSPLSGDLDAAASLLDGYGSIESRARSAA